MGIKVITQEVESPVAPARLFKATVLEGHNLFPKIMPQVIKGVEFVQGDCLAPGSIRQTTLVEPIDGYSYVKHKIDVIEENNLYCKYTTIEGDMHGKNVDFIVTEVKIEPKGAGSLTKMTNHFHSKEGCEPVLEEAKIEVGMQKVAHLGKIVDEYLIANPSVCA